MAASNDYTDFYFDIFAGATLERDLVFTDSFTDDPFPISGFSEIWFTARRNENQIDPPIFELTKTGGEVTTIDDTGGVARLTASAALTNIIIKTTILLCDIKTKETGGREIIQKRGKLTIRQTPTKEI